MKGRVLRIRALVIGGLLSTVLLGACNQHPIAGPLVIEPNAASLHQIGHFDPATSTLVAERGESGVLHYGPYAVLAPGAYEAYFTVSAEADATAGTRVDVNASTPGQPGAVLATMQIPTGSVQRKLTLAFTAAADAKLEFRVISDGSAVVKLHRIEIKKL